MSKAKYHLFECFGIELEYMVVNRETLAPLSQVDEILKEKNGGVIIDEVENGSISWSNELMLHVIELKTTSPASSLTELSDAFHQNVIEINEIAKKLDAVLLPSAMHPFLNPDTDVRLWPHDRNEIYEKYNEIFNCKGHGWSNLQSTHINLPFADDAEFEMLHSAIRLALPLIPALSASSPIKDLQYNTTLDGRLEVYKNNQKRIPSIAGKVIPEWVDSQKSYEEDILKRIYQDIAPYDPDGLLQHEWLNSRGAIARFDRMAIEIRIIDIQECPKADLAIAETVVALLKYIIQVKQKKNIETDELAHLYNQVVSVGGKAITNNFNYLKAIGITQPEPMSATSIWRYLLPQLELTEASENTINYLLENGSLAERIKHHLGPDLDKKRVQETYQKLANCLQDNVLL